MKKLRIFLTALLAFSMTLSAFGVYAQADISRVEANVNYDEGFLEITYTSSLKYDAYVNIYVAEVSDNAVFTDYENSVRIAQGFCNANESMQIKIKTDAGLDGYYDIFAAPGGVDAESGYAKTMTPVYIMGADGRKEILKEINAAAEGSIGDLIFQNLKETLGLTEIECPDWKNSYVYEIKKDDFQGEFKSLDDIAKAWAVADCLYELRFAENSNALGVALESSEKINIDTKNKDYTRYKEYLLEKLFVLVKETEIKSEKDLAEGFRDCAALTAVNNRDTEGIAAALTEYADLLIKESLKDDLEEVGTAAVARLLSGGDDFASTEAVVSKVEDLIASLQNADNGDETSSRKPSSSGRGSGSVTLPKTEYTEQENAMFRDVPSDYWAKTAIEYLARKAVINGFPDGTYRGASDVTREEFVKMIVTAFGVQINPDAAELIFKDVDASFWAAGYIRTAVDAGIVTGMSDAQFGTGASISRQDAAVIIARCLKYKDVSLVSEEEKVFADEGDIAGYAKEAVNLMSGAGLINGYEDNTFRPQNVLNRAEAAKIIYESIIR